MPGNYLSDLVGIPSVQTVKDLQTENTALKTQVEGIQVSLTHVAAVHMTQIISSEGDLPALTWAWVKAPTGITKKYRYSQTGRKVVLDVAIRATTPGLQVSSVTFPFPAEAPTPIVMSLVGPNSLAYPGQGGISDGINVNLAGGGAGIFRVADAGSERKYEIRLSTSLGLLAGRTAQAQFEYLTE